MMRILKNKWLWMSLPLLAIAGLLSSNEVLRRTIFHGIPMGAGVTAKLACTGVYVMGRELNEVIERDMIPFDPSMMEIASLSVDREQQTVSATMMGLFTQTALYRPGVGCTLMQGVSRDELLEQSDGIHEHARTHRKTLWPEGDLVKLDKSDAAVDWAQLERGLDSAFEDKTVNKTIDTRAVIVVYDGKIIAERYADGFDHNSRFLAWSTSKSVTSALIGTMVSDGLLNVGEPAPVPEWSHADDPRGDIHLNHLLTMTTGLEFTEPYIPGNDSTKMLFHNADMGSFAASKPLEHSPGTHWYYSSGTTNILSGILFDKAGGSLKALHEYSWSRFFEPLGMTSAVFEPDASGSFVGASYFHASARDMARFGLLFLNEGRAGDKQVLSREWVNYTRTPTDSAPMGQYGAQFWLNAGHPTRDEGRLMPDCPTDLYATLGYSGQDMAIIPSKKAIIVRLGWATGGEEFDTNQHFSKILKALPDADKQ